MNLDAPPQSPWNDRVTDAGALTTRDRIDWDDPIPEPEPYPETLTPHLAALLSWHHDHYQGTGPDGDLRFRRFTGYEPEPGRPAGFEWLERFGMMEGPDVHGFHAAFTRIAREVRAARQLWAAERHDALVLRTLHDATPAMNNYRAARQDVQDAYTALTSTDDNRWRAAVCTLVAARAHARTMARDVDRHGAVVLTSYRQLPDNACEKTADVDQMAANANIDIRGVWPTGDGDETVEQQLDRLIAGQDALIAEVLRLSVGTGA